MSKAGLYLHIPFCRRVCPYCDFSVRTGAATRRATFVTDLIQEISRWRNRWSTPLTSIYFGGGTPSQLEGSQIAQLLDAVREHLPLAGNTTVILEANPEDVSTARCDEWKHAGVASLSLGVQALAADRLRWLGRAHSATDVARAIEAARGAGFTTISCDLIYGLPGEDRNRLATELEQFIALAPDHISAYQLTISSTTSFGRAVASGSMQVLDESAQARAFHHIHRRLASAGYLAYEVSNFARALAHESPHNWLYWQGAPYLGVGPSAHAYDGAARRWWNHAKLPDWERCLRSGQDPIAGEEHLSPSQRALETVMLVLRTRVGLDLTGLSARLDLPLCQLNAKRLERWQQDGLISWDGRTVQATRRGWSVIDSLVRGMAFGELWHQ